MPKSIPFESHHQEFLSDPEQARIYLEVALEEYEKDANSEAFLLALRDVAAARGGLGKLAQRTKLNRGHIYRTLSNRGNPRLDTLVKILRTLGFKLSVEPLSTK
jgi:probable addiction module antidote protein